MTTYSTLCNKCPYTVPFATNDHILYPLQQMPIYSTLCNKWPYTVPFATNDHIQYPLQQMTIYSTLCNKWPLFSYHLLFCLHCFIFTAVWTSIFPTSILYSGVRSTLLLAAFAWSISMTCPRHLQFPLMSLALTAVLYNFISYWIVLIFHTTCSVAGSHTFLRFFLPNTKPEFLLFCHGPRFTSLYQN